MGLLTLGVWRPAPCRRGRRSGRSPCSRSPCDPPRSLQGRYRTRRGCQRRTTPSPSMARRDVQGYGGAHRPAGHAPGATVMAHAQGVALGRSEALPYWGTEECASVRRIDHFRSLSMTVLCQEGHVHGHTSATGTGAKICPHQP